MLSFIIRPSLKGNLKEIGGQRVILNLIRLLNPRFYIIMCDSRIKGAKSFNNYETGGLSLILHIKWGVGGWGKSEKPLKYLCYLESHRLSFKLHQIFWLRITFFFFLNTGCTLPQWHLICSLVNRHYNLRSPNLRHLTWRQSPRELGHQQKISRLYFRKLLLVFEVQWP